MHYQVAILVNYEYSLTSL